MNYPFRKTVLDFLLNYVDGRQAMRLLESLRENYPKENFYVMMNLIGSHDVERAITLLGEAPFYDGMPAIHQSRFKLDAEHYKLGTDRLRLAALLQMTYPGMPCIYYGDEIGMQGFRDPYNRSPYAWENPDISVRDWYRKLIRLRNEHTALQTGDLLPLAGEGNILAYARTIRSGTDEFGAPAKNEAFVVVINRSRTQEEKVMLKVGDFLQGTLQEALEGEERVQVQRGVLTVKIPPLSARIYEAVHERLVEHLRRLDIQLAITEAPSPWLEQYPVFAPETLGLVAPAAWFTDAPPPAQLAWSELGDYPLVLPGKNVGIRYLIDRHCRAQNLALLPDIESDSLNLNSRWVAQGRYATILPASAMHSLIERGQAQFIPLMPPLERQLHISHLRHRQPGADEARLLAHFYPGSGS